MSKKFKIADWNVDPTQCLMLKPEVQVKLEPKAMALLVALADANGELVPRNKLFELIWPNQHVTDYALNTLVANLRKNLGKLEDGSQMIETRPKLGYRLNTSVILPDESAIVEPTVKQLSSRQTRTRSYVIALLISLPVFLLGWYLFNNVNSTKPLEENKVIDDSHIIVNRYLVKVTLSYSDVALDAKNQPYCTNFDYETVVKAVYKNGQWMIINDFFEYKLQHTGKSLVGVSETHQVEYKHAKGTEVDVMTVNINELGELTGSAVMEVQDEAGNKICEGKSFFMGGLIRAQ